MTQLSHQELIERCNGQYKAVLTGIRRHCPKLTDAERNAVWEAQNVIDLCRGKLQSQKAEIERLRNPWVPIEDIPEEWKDGRELYLLIHESLEDRYEVKAQWKHTGENHVKWPDEWPEYDWWYIAEQEFFEAYDYLSPRITHVRLPLNLPQPTTETGET